MPLILGPWNRDISRSMWVLGQPGIYRNTVLLKKNKRYNCKYAWKVAIQFYAKTLQDKVGLAGPNSIILGDSEGKKMKTETSEHRSHITDIQTSTEISI